MLDPISIAHDLKYFKNSYSGNNTENKFKT
jgi:hypothetical protein